MNRGSTMLLGVLLVAVAFAGCLGGDEPTPGQGGAAGDGPQRSLAIADDGAESERAQARVASVTGDVAYDDLVVTVNGDVYTFGADASYRDATYTVNGVDRGTTAVEEGTILQVPAAGTVDLSFRDQATGTVWGAYETTVPDDDAPSSPPLESPGDGESGVSRQPIFEWDPAADPSGVTYGLQVSLDETFSQDALVDEYRDLTSNEFQMNQDDELLPGQTYYWHVRATDAAGNVGPWSPTWSFTTGVQ